jgi:hypothetical protein
MRRFEDSWKRIDRAMIHGKAFTAECEGLIDPKSYKTGVEHKGDGTFVVVVRASQLPEHNVAIELGELFYQLRAALDALIFKATETESFPNAPASEDRIEFPIYPADNGKFESSAVYKGPLPKELKDWLKAIQPYNAAKSSNPWVVEVGRRLGLLHDCARKDRHRRLHVIAAVPTAMQWSFNVSNGAITHERQLNADFLKHQTEFLEFQATGWEREDFEINLASRLTLEISIGEMPGLAGQSVVSELEGITDTVRWIVDTFEKACQ